LPISYCQLNYCQLPIADCQFSPAHVSRHHHVRIGYMPVAFHAIGNWQLEIGNSTLL
jgi:hypothetical protein